MKHVSELAIESATGFARARVGFIIPSGNALCEPQLQRFAPPDLGVHIMRLALFGNTP